jgi:TRAP-type C4-dicarboxylate transport system permease small subunit
MIINWLIRINAKLQRIEDVLLPALFILTLLLAVLQIVLRNIFGVGLVWIDPLLRILVLWLGMLGAMYATRKKRHISIDVIRHYLGPQLKQQLQRLIYLASSIICLICFYFSIPYLILEYEDGSSAFSQVPLWLTESIIPFALLVMALRFLFFTRTP